MARKLDNWLKSYLEYTENTEAPTGFNFWVGVWTIAGVLRRRVWIDMGHFQWYPNFYLFLVAPPGVVSKSTTLSIGTKLLECVPDIHFGPEAMTWEALTQALGKSLEEVPMEINGEKAFYPMSCLSIAAGELGTLINPHNRDLIDALVSLWDGKQGSWEKWTKASGSDKIINPWLNIASCTTPAWIAQNFPEALIGGGFTSRCIFVYADTKRQLIPYPHLHQKPNFYSLQKDLVSDLVHMSRLKGPYVLSPEALEFGTQWYTDHYTKRPEGIDPVRFGGYLARKQTHMHKTAMVLAACSRDEMIIERRDLETALALVNSIEPHMQKVFESIGVEGAGRYLMSLVQVLQGAGGSLPRGALFHAVSRSMSLDEFEQTLVSAASAGYIQVTSNGVGVQISLIQKEGVKDELPNVKIG